MGRIGGGREEESIKAGIIKRANNDVHDTNDVNDKNFYHSHHSIIFLDLEAPSVICTDFTQCIEYFCSMH